ncbi:MAG: hypothetical protein JNN27_20230 [Planctomycetes bacterium]|nr:hypothetical protein [Planctomycetota bacterium]
MPRPLRRLYAAPAAARRRHRTWMVAMTLATFGAAVWGAALVWRYVEPESAPGLGAVWMLASAFTAPGFLLAFLTLRAKTAWLLLAAIPLAANGMMLVLPYLALKLR